MNTISERLSYLLNSKGLTPYAFCAKTGYNKASISRTLSANSVPNEKNLKLIIDYFDVTREWLINGIEPIYQSNFNINQPSTDMEAKYFNIINTLVETNAKLLEENIALKTKMATLESSSLGERKQPRQEMG